MEVIGPTSGYKERRVAIMGDTGSDHCAFPEQVLSVLSPVLAEPASFFAIFFAI